MAIDGIGCSGNYALEMSQLAQASETSQVSSAQPIDVANIDAPAEQIDSSAQAGVATRVDLYV